MVGGFARDVAERARDLLGMHQPEHRVVIGEDARLLGIPGELAQLIAIAVEQIIGARALAALRRELLIDPTLQPAFEVIEGGCACQRKSVALRLELVDEKNFRGRREQIDSAADGVGEVMPKVDVAAEGERLLPLTQELEEVVVHPNGRPVRFSCRNPPGAAGGSDFE